MSKDEFFHHLRIASKWVERFPPWKRGILKQSGEATVAVPRTPIATTWCRTYSKKDEAIEAMQDRLATLGQAKWVYDLCRSAGIAPTPLVRREATGRDDVVTESEGE